MNQSKLLQRVMAELYSETKKNTNKLMNINEVDVKNLISLSAKRKKIEGRINY